MSLQDFKLPSLKDKISNTVKEDVEKKTEEKKENKANKARRLNK